MTDEIPVPFEVFLVGDTGGINRTKPDPVLETLKAHLIPRQESAVIFLGDNVYPRGLPEPGHLLRKDAEATLKAHHEALKDYHGKVVFIGGNHDWNKGRSNGYDYIVRQEKYIEKLFGGKNVFLPTNGCPGPTELNVSPHLTMIMINTQWWMQKNPRPVGKQFGCRVSSEDDFFKQLEDMIEENKHRHILVAGHHPVYSYAIHGGKFKLKHHIFPLTLYDPDAYIPLPFIGSLLPLYRKWLGAKEDMSHPRYRGMRNKLKELFARYPNLIYASGHEHNLQYIHKNLNHFIVSGAGSKLKYVLQNGRHLEFGQKCKGFFKLRFENDGSVTTSAWTVDRANAQGQRIFEKKLM
ncbi:metallophosphoesterase [Hufsiella ginkgonis]|uniref:Metallophosphoesterase n=1 Tax=Hufsiella ginkgonis TaxID=2695274 RepID=A0A7K1XXR5_9SPHI|nr:metallophosphoesterase [Hufsiella ginkgonis]MXV15529.1 metallophosphoesterase [Hufsiella ginkgonis]